MASLSISEASSSQGSGLPDFIPRAYQLELYEQAKRENSILVLGTGSGKTFISILLLKDLGHQIRKLQNKNRKWTVFVVNTVPLVYQQGRAIQQHTPFSVGFYERSVGVDFWKEEEWRETLEENEVLVIIAQIFYDILLHKYLSLDQVNLLILDECHHATGNHPMREVMRLHHDLRERKPDCCPRVMGLTACVIHKKCKTGEVTKKLRELETTMCCTLVSPVDAEAVKQHSTAPKEIVIAFDVSEPSEYAERIAAQLVGIGSEVDEMKGIEDKHKKTLKKKLKNISDIMYHLGDWCGAQAVKYEMENFEDAEDYEEIPALRDVKKLICQRLCEIHKYCLREEDKISSPMKHITKKVQRLLDILCECRKQNICGLLFVERRNTAKLLYEFLKELASESEAFSFIRPMYVVSANNCSVDINLVRNELIKQKETLARFTSGELNFLISTSVLEEGVDVRKCNIVIRFDKPVNFRSYVQSRGRARAIPSRYVLMMEVDKVNELLSSIALYREIEIALTKLCHNRQLPTDLETRAHFAEDEYIAPYKPYGPDGPSITFISCISLINVYCGKLPQDKFTELVPDIVYKKSEEEEEEKKVMAGIKLPINSCLRTYIYGDWMKNKDHAKRSAAMALCKKLHEIKELNDHLCPVEKLDESILEDLVEVQPEEATKDGTAEPGTKKRRQVYSKEMCQAFSSMSNGFKLYSVIVQSKAPTSSEIAIDSEVKNMSVGLLCKQTLRPPPFTLYSPKWSEVVVRIHLIDEHVQLDSDIMNHVDHFHKLVFETLLEISPSLFHYFPQQTSLLILPMKAGRIDTSLLNHIRTCDSLKIKEMTSSVDIFNFEMSVFEDSIIYPFYALSEGMFYVTKIEDHMNPQGKFPEGKGYGSYEDYFFLKYDRKITNKGQPLISAKHLPKDLNFLEKLNEAKKKSGREPPKFVPELCGVFPIKASLWWQIMLLPSVFHRLNSLSLAEELSKKMTSPHSCLVPNWQSIEYDNLDFDWSEKLIKKIMQSPGRNLSVILANAKPTPIQPFMILNALTLKGARDNFDAERLEVLGDSFLKFIVAEYLFLKFSDDHEGKLSQRRSMLVSNRTLYTLGKEKKIPGKIQGKVLNPPLNAVPGFVLKTKMELKLREMNAPHDLWARFDKMTEESFKEEIIKASGGRTSCYNPWTEHELGDKSVADSVEALIGVYLLVGGSKAAINFLCNLGIGVCKGTSLLKMKLPIKSALLSKEEEANDEVDRYYNQCCLDILEKKINYTFRDRSFIVQAVTHSSFIQNRVTDCYQRLEFLGDAVLDYLVTGMVFSLHTSYNPGQMSDLRSYYVKNETLARASANHKLQQHMLYLAPKLQYSIEKYLTFYESGLDDEELLTEDETMDIQDVEVPKALGDLVEAIIGAVYLDSDRSLQKAWDVVEALMGDIIEQTLTHTPVNCIRQMYEKGARFVKLDMEDDNPMARYEIKVQGLPPLIGCGKNYKVAKMAAAKAAVRKLKEKEKEKTPMAPGF